VHFLRLLAGLLDWYVGRQLIICTPNIHFFQMFSPAKVIFTGVGVLFAVGDPHNLYELLLMPSCQAAKDVGASQDMLTDLFERIESLFKRSRLTPKCH
jgi:hypothetical protein